MRELFVLGTASQVPTRHRNHNAYFLRWDEQGILFDPGEGTQRQLTLAGLSAHAITRICITHFHGDHCLGLPGIIQRLSLEDCPQVAIYYPASGQKYFDNLRNSSIYAHFEKIEAHPISKNGILYEDETGILEAMALDHEVDCYGYRVRERDQFRIRKDRLKASGLEGPKVGQLLREGQVEFEGKTIRRHDVAELRTGQSFAFIMDTRRCKGAEELARGVDLLVCESTFLKSETELALHAGHLTAEQAAELARDVGARKLVLTHFSQRYQDNQSFLDEARTIHDDVVVAVEPNLYDAHTNYRIPVPSRKPI